MTDTATARPEPAAVLEAASADALISGALDALAELRGVPPGCTLYDHHAKTAIAHAGAAIALLLDAFVRPAVIPGLPPGWTLVTHQNDDGARLHGYVLTGPDGTRTASRHMWPDTAGAVAAGIRAARQAEDGTDAGQEC